jgi:hypothetical protein
VASITSGSSRRMWGQPFPRPCSSMQEAHTESQMQLSQLTHRQQAVPSLSPLSPWWLQSLLRITCPFHLKCNITLRRSLYGSIYQSCCTAPNHGGSQACSAYSPLFLRSLIVLVPFCRPYSTHPPATLLNWPLQYNQQRGQIIATDRQHNKSGLTRCCCAMDIPLGGCLQHVECAGEEVVACCTITSPLFRVCRLHYLHTCSAGSISSTAPTIGVGVTATATAAVPHKPVPHPPQGGQTNPPAAQRQ